MTLDQEQSKQLYELEQSFYQMSSDFSKKTVTKVYLNQRGLSSAGLTAAKIGSAYLLYTLFEKETVDGFWSAVSEGYSMLQYARMCIHSADALSGLPTFYHLKHKASKYVNAWHDLLRRDGIREGFINTLGQSADERSYSPRTCCQSAKGCHIEADTFI